MEVGLFYEVGFLPDGVHLQKIIYGDADGGVRSVVAEVDVVDFYRGSLSLGAQQIYIRLMHVAGSIAEPGLRTLGAVLQSLGELPVEVVGGE